MIKGRGKKPTRNAPNAPSSGPSRAGFHFIQTYLGCRREFYFRYLLGLRKKTTSPPLNFGRAIHEGMATFYRTSKELEAVKAFEQVMAQARGEFANPSDYDACMEKGPILLRAWINTHGRNDLRNFTIVGSEMELSAYLPNKYLVTGRLDVLLKDKAGNYLIKDAKTSSSSITLTRVSGELSDQGTTYCWLFEKCYPKLASRLSGFMLDILYWNENSTRTSNIALYRADIIKPSKFWLAAFETYTMDILVEIAQRTKAVLDKTHEPTQAFCPNTGHCFAYHRVCDYIDVCRTNIRFKQTLQGFETECVADFDALSNMDMRFDVRKYGKDNLSKLKETKSFVHPKTEVNVVHPAIEIENVSPLTKARPEVRKRTRSTQVAGLGRMKGRSI